MRTVQVFLFTCLLLAATDGIPVDFPKSSLEAREFAIEPDATRVGTTQSIKNFSRSSRDKLQHESAKERRFQEPPPKPNPPSPKAPKPEENAKNRPDAPYTPPIQKLPARILRLLEKTVGKPKNWLKGIAGMLSPLGVIPEVDPMSTGTTTENIKILKDQIKVARDPKMKKALQQDLNCLQLRVPIEKHGGAINGEGWLGAEGWFMETLRKIKGPIPVAEFRRKLAEEYKILTGQEGRGFVLKFVDPMIEQHCFHGKVVP